MSAISAVGNPYSAPISTQPTKAQPAQQVQQPAATNVQPVATDSDGDNDGSVGKNIDVKA